MFRPELAVGHGGFAPGPCVVMTMTMAIGTVAWVILTCFSLGMIRHRR